MNEDKLEINIEKNEVSKKDLFKIINPLSKKYFIEIDKPDNYLIKIKKNIFPLKKNQIESYIKNSINKNKELFSLIINNEKYYLNKFRFKKINENYLITTDFGDFTYLNEKEFLNLKQYKLDENKVLLTKLINSNIIIKENSIKNYLQKGKNKLYYLNQGASLHIVIPTLRCNYSCVYCHANASKMDSKETDMTQETAKKVVDFIFQSQSKHIMIEFQGGEPLLKFDIIKYVVNYALKKNKIFKKELSFSVVTNLSLMNNEMFDFFVDNLIGICTSLDGNEELQNKNRPSIDKKNTYDVVVFWLNKLKEEYKKRSIVKRRVNALTTITKDSLEKYDKIINEYVNLGIKEIHLRPLNNLGKADYNWNKLSYSPEEFLEFWEKSLDYIIEINKKGTELVERGVTIFLKKIFSPFDPNYLELRSPCGALIGQIAYTPEGNIYSCDEARMIESKRFCFGNVVQDNYLNVIKSDKSKELIKSSITEGHICNFCVYKPYCGVCPVCNFKEFGSLYPQIMSTSRCKINMGQLEYIFEKMKDSEVNEIFKKWLNL